MTIQASKRGAPIPAKGMYRRIARNSAFLAGGTAASSLLTMLAVAFAARMLSAREFGILVMFQSAVLMIGALTSFSTQQPVIKLGAEAQSAGDKRRLGAVVSMGLMVDLTASLLAFSIALLLIDLWKPMIGLTAKYAGAAQFVAASLLFTGYPTSNGIFRLYDRFDLLSVIQTLSAAGLLAAFALLFAVGAGFGTLVRVWAAYLSISSVLQLVLGLGLLRRDHVPLLFKRRLFLTSDGRTLLHYCWGTWGTSTTETIRTNGDSLLVGAIVSVEAAGLYAAARQLSGILRKFNVVYTSTVFPEIARLASQNNVEGARRLKLRMLWAGLATAALAVGVAAVFGRIVLQLLFGARFGFAYLPFVLLTAAAAAQLISHTPSMYVQVYRGPGTQLILYVIATFAFALLAVPLTFALSITGTALAQVAFSLFLTLLCNFALRKTTKVARRGGAATDCPESSQDSFAQSYHK